MSAPSAKRMRSCHNGKRAYPSIEAAQQAIVSLVRKRAKQGNPIVTYLQAYGCACGKFHFGNTRQIDWSRVK